MKPAGADERRLPFSEAAERNTAPILAELADRLPESGTVLEIGAGTGQHAVHFARAFPHLGWLPTELPDLVPALAARRELQGSPNLLPPIPLDVLRDRFPAGPFAAVYSANTAHIMPWDAVRSAVAGTGAVLAPGGPFFLYGPFMVDGRPTTPSNAAFDRNLRDRDPAMGLRDVDAVQAVARAHGMRLEEVLAMPANNFLLVFRRVENLHEQNR